MRTLIVPEVRFSSSMSRRWDTPPASSSRASVTSAPNVAAPSPYASNTLASSRSM
jgi:hypothetical protein